MVRLFTRVKDALAGTALCKVILGRQGVMQARGTSLEEQRDANGYVEIVIHAILAAPCRIRVYHEIIRHAGKN